MKLQHQCEIRAPLAVVWDLTSRIDEIAPCLPGASAVKADDGNFDGTIKLRLGPLDLLFRGKIAIAERDAKKALMVLKGKANESSGQGSASATTTIQMTEVGRITLAAIDTDLLISGRVAQMGRGIISEVSDELLTKFVSNLEKHLETKISQPEFSGSVVEDHSKTVNDLSNRSQNNLERHISLIGLLWRVVRRRILQTFRRVAGTS